MRAFIVRPFNPRNGIDFDRVQKELIDPALRQAEIAGDTTQQFVEAGNIRVDMFEQLLLADLVIADISVHNANVFYELGIRHALRSRQTILIRAKVTKPREDRTADDEVPFDLRTDRYLEYDHADPAASLPDLQRALADTKAGERKDSPVFLSLPTLAEQERSRFLPVPSAFFEEAERASAAKDVAHLGLLAAEASGFVWETEGWRRVGKMLFDLGAWRAAQRTLERIRSVDPDDLEANLWLATVYQRLNELTLSDQALGRVLRNAAATRRHKSEAWALRGSNEKLLWVQSWAALAPEQWSEAALRSPYLEAAFKSYEKAFSQDLNSFYPGLVALSLLTIRRELIGRHPAVFDEPFDEPEEARVALMELERALTALAGAVHLALEADQESEWYPMSAADYEFLVAKKPAKALAAYRKALKGEKLFHSASARRQLQIFVDLGLKADRITDCIALFAEAPPPQPRPPHIVVFTGHRVDAAGRNPPRFPESCVNAARETMRTRLAELRPSLGIAAAASGGDIIFHEVCEELGIPTNLLLVMPPQLFVNESVADSGQQWVNRYWSLVERRKAEGRFTQLGDRDELPGWVQRKQQYSIWNRANLWTLEYALSMGPERLTVMALWNGREGDGPGGTKDLLTVAKELGATPAVIDTNELCVD
jgi:tetratricopeptide (TPR) repeat protein